MPLHSKRAVLWRLIFADIALSISIIMVTFLAMSAENLLWPLASTSWDSKELEAMREVIDSRNFTMGSVTREFETEFAKWCGVRYAVMVNSGSSANLVGAFALKYSGRERSVSGTPEVIVPAVSWSTTYFPFHQAGYKLIFVDVDPWSFNIDPGLVAEAIGENTVGIVGVNLLGNPANWANLRKLATENDLWLFEDNCESMGAESLGNLTGTFGDVGTFSFFYSHHICTMEGGMVTTNSEEIYNILRSLRAHGWARELSIDEKFMGFPRLNEWAERFRFYLPGFNVRPLELSAAIGIQQLKKFERLLIARRKNAEKLKTYLATLDTQWRLQNSEIGSSWFTFGFVYDGDDSKRAIRDRCVNFMESSGISTRPIVAGNFVNNPVMKHLNYRVPKPLTRAERIDKNGFMIGNHHFSLEHQFEVLGKNLLESEKL